MSRRNKKEDVLEILLGNDFVSGEYISDLLNISRVMVNRYVKELISEGFEIESLKHRGYRLKMVPDVVYTPMIKSRFDIKDYNVIIFNTLPSTNSYCLSNADKLADKTVIIARHQTQGRGRLDRSWYSENDKDITMSILLKPNIPVDKVMKYTISASLSVLDALKDFDIEDISIKWPNDIYYKDKKICGILTETTLQYDTGLVENLVIGIGLNVNSEVSKVIPNAISMYEILGFEIKRYTIIGKIISSFDHHINQTYDELFENWRKNIGFIGKKIIVKVGNEEIKCRFIDVSKTGEIIVEENNTIRKFGYGEVSIIL